MHIMSVVGARPQLVKLAAVADGMPPGHRHTIVHTGQHYDRAMSGAFFEDLHIPEPDVHLGVGSGGHGVQTGRMLAALDPVLDEHRPDWVVVYGDTNSTVAAALGAVKLHLPVAHLEAGLRSFNRRMPEEHNRVLTDHAADLCLAPTQVAMDHLAAEGLAARSRLVGDVMTDVLYRVRDAVQRRPAPLPPGVRAEDGYVVATVHRAENTDDPRRLRAVVDALAQVPVTVLLAAHPRLLDSATRSGIELARGRIVVCPPQPYPGLVSWVLRSRGVVTDSGGLQKEAFLLRVPCTTVRHETEWVETVALGWNVLAGDLDGVGQLAARGPLPPTDAAPYGDGRAVVRVLEALER